MSAQEPHWRTRALRSMGPRVYFGQAAGYPLPVKWFLWFCLLLIWPVWIFTVLLGIALGYAGYQLLWVLIWPLRVRLKRKDPEEYAAFMAKNWPNKKP